jgi:hypothetical protein
MKKIAFLSSFLLLASCATQNVNSFHFEHDAFENQDYFISDPQDLSQLTKNDGVEVTAFRMKKVLLPSPAVSFIFVFEGHFPFEVTEPMEFLLDGKAFSLKPARASSNVTGYGRFRLAHKEIPFALDADLLKAFLDAKEIRLRIDAVVLRIEASIPPQALAKAKDFINQAGAKP